MSGAVLHRVYNTSITVAGDSYAFRALNPTVP